MLAVSMLSARLLTTRQFALAQLDIMDHHSLNAHDKQMLSYQNRNALGMRNVRMIRLASIRNVGILALKERFAVKMPSAMFNCIVRCACVMKDTLEMLKFSVICVSILSILGFFVVDAGCSQ